MSEKLKNPETGYWNCKVVATGEENVYHASTANILEKKGMLKVLSKVDKLKPKVEKK